MDSPPPSNDWSRHWPWLVGCVALVMLLGAVFLALFSVTMTGIKSSEVYQQALDQASTNRVLVKRLGSPIRPGRLVTGEIISHRTVGEGTELRGSARLKIPLRGPLGRATLNAEADRMGSVWTVTRLEAELKGTEEQLDLLAPGTE